MAFISLFYSGMGILFFFVLCLERHITNRRLGAAPLGGVSLLHVYAWLAPVFSVLDGGKVATDGLTYPFFHK